MLKLTQRSVKFFNLWYQDQRYYRMHPEDWIYCGLLLWLSVVSFDLGLFIGWSWTLFI